MSRPLGVPTRLCALGALLVACGPHPPSAHSAGKDAVVAEGRGPQPAAASPPFAGRSEDDERSAPPPSPAAEHGERGEGIGADAADAKAADERGGARTDEAGTGGAPGSDVGAEPAPPSTPVKVVVEAPFKLYERPRAEGWMLAAGQDEKLARWNVGGTGDPSFVSNRQGYHPAPRVVVDTKVLNARLPEYVPKARRRTALSQWRITAVTRKYGYWPFRICYQDGLRIDQAMEGETVLRFSIGTSGKITAARLLRSELDEAVAECLVDRTRGYDKLRYSPAPSKRLDVEMRIRLWPGDAPVPSLGPPEPDQWENPGALDGSAVDDAVRPILPDVERCYRKGLTDDPGLWGRLEVRLDVDEIGKLRRAVEHDSRFPDARVTRCVLGRLRTISLPPPDGGALTFVWAVRFGEPPP